MEEHDIYNPYSGVTTNISEGFNNIIKWVNSHKKLPVDNMVLSLFYLQNSTYAEVLRGRAGLGNFSLKDEYQFAALEPEDLKFPHKVIQPVCLFVLLLYVPSQQLWSLRDGQFT